VAADAADGVVQGHGAELEGEVDEAAGGLLHEVTDLRGRTCVFLKKRKYKEVARKEGKTTT
jgi:hypothetical protein